MAKPQPHPLASMLSEAFGETIDLDAYGKDGYDVGEGPGERDFDADEYVESKAPKSYNEDDYRTRRDTPQDQANVKRAYEDAASRQADQMMAQYQTQLAQPSAVASRLQLQDPNDPDAQRIAAINFLRGQR